MRRRFLTVAATAALVASACGGGTATTTPSESAAASAATSAPTASASTAASASSAASASAAPSAAASYSTSTYGSMNPLKPAVDLSKVGGPGEGSLNIIIWAGYAESGKNDKVYDWVTPFQKRTPSFPGKLRSRRRTMRAAASSCARGTWAGALSP